MRLSIIVAVAENGVVGRNNSLPWHIPGDLKYFRRVTLGKPVVMGRKTFESIGKPLPGRTNIVVTRNTDYAAPGISVVGSVGQALSLAEAVAQSDGEEELMVIGGAEIYAAALPLADRLYLTEVHAVVEGDAHLPVVEWDDWREVSRERHEGETEDAPAYSFVVYQRPGGA